jgi:hypothetical protein
MCHQILIETAVSAIATTSTTTITTTTTTTTHSPKRNETIDVYFTCLSFVETKI